MLYGRSNQITMYKYKIRPSKMLAFVLRAMKMKWNKTRTHHRFDFTLCISENRQFVLQTTKYVLLTLPLYANTCCLLRIRISEFIIITFTNRKKNMNAEAEIEKNENKNQNNNMSMHVNKISIICCWFFGKHGVRTRYLSVFNLIKLQFFFIQKETRTVQRNIVDVLQDFRSMHGLFN